MASGATAPRKQGMDPRIVKSISQLCLQNWPTPAITWASTPIAHKDAVWAEFKKRYRWADEQGPVISDLFWQKCAARTKDILAKERKKAMHNAEIDHQGHAMEHMHEYSPWWCSADIWAEMCVKWRDENWQKKRKTASSNRAGGGEKAKGTYKGGSISQLQHMAVKESQSQGTPIHWLDVYVETRDGLPDAVNIANTYRRLLDERYPEGTPRPIIDQELWERASIVKKNYVKGQGQKRRPSISGFSCSTQSSQSSSQPFVHTPADCVRAICQNRELLLELGGHLGAMDPEDLARAVAAAAASQQQDGDEGSHHDDRDDEFGGSS
ncbi:hypothetical protein POM88_005397 [Heracleum sosnowskyi]|uniref:Transposase n=1 Tax=Heracleum sosnowskyi TaxID=360622 RepID=A0AAD8J272_9APIA|nr:hypothetical protein POM88_035977 [Heracleum sosnowskyi]KAK1395534.1 hypothetical protein POM88_005397 [Heracleum sosnowskyi]